MFLCSFVDDTVSAIVYRWRGGEISMGIAVVVSGLVLVYAPYFVHF